MPSQRSACGATRPFAPMSVSLLVVVIALTRIGTRALGELGGRQDDVLARSAVLICDPCWRFDGGHVLNLYHLGSETSISRIREASGARSRQARRIGSWTRSTARMASRRSGRRPG